MLYFNMDITKIRLMSNIQIYSSCVVVADSKGRAIADPALGQFGQRLSDLAGLN
jgi:hypothetical protein